MKPVRSLSAIAAVVIPWLLFVVSVSADGPTRGLLVVTADHLDPGQQFSVLGSRIDPGTTVTFRLDHDARSAPLGNAYVAQDGTLSATFDLAPDFPLGDAWLRGQTSSGTDLELYVHVGPRAVAPAASGVATDGSGPYVDIAAIAGIVFVIGVVIFVLASGRYVLGRGNDTPAGH